tara:strand:- start:127047 stop:128222 length:1176 start_codon:yes stop_codon:yes gene_type:complete
MQTIIRSLIDQVRFADVLDILIVAGLLYVAIVWLKNRASRSLALVAGGLTLIFVLARSLNLYLTGMAFHYGLVGTVLAMVVVFQHDIRHGFERLASARWFRSTPTDSLTRRIVDTITEAVDEMAQKRIGALIVFGGKQPLDRHIHGGVQVDAKISLPLLLSIFNPDSPGHDGAVLIERDRIAFLGVHLPLTIQVAKGHAHGTRHAAALGLSECCDAIIVAVSEERGTITVAENGELTVIEAADLPDRLARYVDHRHDQLGRTRQHRVSDGLSGIAAFAVAIVLWFTFAYHTDVVQRTFLVPIEYRNLSNDLEFAEPKPSYVEVTLSGPEQAFVLLDLNSVSVSFDLKKSAEQRIYRLQTASNLTNIPDELMVVATAPSEVLAITRQKLKVD